MKRLFFFICFLTAAVDLYSQSDFKVEVVKVDPNAPKDSIKNYLIISEDTAGFKTEFKGETKVLKDSAALSDYIVKNLGSFNNKVAVEVDEKGSDAFYRITVHILIHNKVPRWMMLWTHEPRPKYFSPH